MKRSRVKPAPKRRPSREIVELITWMHDEQDQCETLGTAFCHLRDYALGFLTKPRDNCYVCQWIRRQRRKKA